MFFNRIIGVFKLDIATFEEIEADQSATGQAALVVLIVALISGIGSGLSASFLETSFFSSFISSVLAAFTGWIVWSFVTYFVGTKFFDGQADMGEMLRVLGFSYAPQVLSIIPCIGWLIGLIWSLVAGFIAVRQGLDLDNTKTLLTIVIGFFAIILVSAIFGLIFGGLAALGSAITG